MRVLSYSGDISEMFCLLIEDMLFVLLFESCVAIFVFEFYLKMFFLVLLVCLNKIEKKTNIFTMFNELSVDNKCFWLELDLSEFWSSCIIPLLTHSDTLKFGEFPL